MRGNQAFDWQHRTSTEAAPKREQKVTVKVRKQGWITKGEKVLYSLIGTAIIIACGFMVSFSSSTDSLNRELQQLEQTVQNQQVINESLLFEVKELERPERITKIARDNGLKIQDTKVKQAQNVNN
ncbi:cell division protein FtsL [Virgibacillus sp. YIM 98842]|jgi:cell division protein FtsL|uniref:cell division protein FtsL n=1 Tax=Virgibacillus sp. YIM 98842 TaxID=2663533 RepID=UPI0013DD85DF|nr:cell division protein FtsL [Virgibacillus sp. YIM 98842]